MSARPVVIPQLNVNEDRVTVVKVLVAQGQRVREGDPVAVVETTKAAVDITAPSAGRIGRIAAVEGRQLAVGAVLCEIEDDLPEPEGLDPGRPGTSAEGAGAALPVTVKARLRARELGVDLALVTSASGRVGVAEVEAFASGRGDPSPVVHGRLRRVRAVIVGGGQHAACVIDAASASGYELIGCLDDGKPVGFEVFGSIKVIGPIARLPELRQQGVELALIGVGGATDNRTRTRLFERTVGDGFVLPPVLHPACYVAPGVAIGPGTVVLARASIGPGTSVGANVVVNQGAIVCHHCTIEDHAHIAPGGILAGRCQVGRGSTVGMGATLLMDVRVGRDCLIYNGVSVVANVPDHSVVRRDATIPLGSG